MKLQKRSIPFVFCVAVGGKPLKTPDDWLNHSEQQMRGDRSRAKLSMTIETETWTRTLSLRSDVEGNDQALVFIDAPAKEKGIGTLRLSGNMWNWFPKLKRKVTVSPSMLLASWMGSDFTNDDLLKASSMAEDYTHAFKPDEKVGAASYKVIENLAKPSSKVMWPKIVTLSDKKDCLPRFHRYYDKKGTLVRTLVMSEVKSFDGHKLPTVWEMRPEGSKKRTRMKYDDVKFKVSFPANHFTMQTLTGN
jgi:hypothetical protein